MKKLWAMIALCVWAQTAGADSLICSYQAKIGDQDKENSKGVSLLQGKQVSAAIAAAIIRQDRANYHEFHQADAEDEDDCWFSTKENRATIEQELRGASVSQAALKQIIFNNPMIEVMIYKEGSLTVEVLEPNSSSIR